MGRSCKTRQKDDECAKETVEVEVESSEVWVSFKGDKSNRNTLITQSFAPA